MGNDKLIEITVNGKKVLAPEGMNLLRFLNEELKLNIPHYCFHPALPEVGSCRLCQVEFILKQKKPDGEISVRRMLGVSCREKVRPGLEIETHSDAAKKARKAAMEFLLVNHPLDCPICDKAGECSLQDYAYQTGQLEGRATEPKRKREKLVDLGDVIIHDQERCILCTRCVRFFKNFEGRAQLGVFQRGDRSYVGTFFGEPLKGNYQGNLADICPVGSLTLKKFRFKQRVWDLRPVPSICPLCSRGCNIFIDVGRKDIVRRIRPRINQKINGYFICDFGRLNFDYLNDKENRLLYAFSREHGELKEKPIDEAIIRAGEILKEAYPSILALASPYLTVEEGKAFSSLFEGIETKGFYSPKPSGLGDDKLLTDDPCPNRKGLESLGLKPLSDNEIKEAVSKSKIVFMAGEKLETLLEKETIKAIDASKIILISTNLSPEIENAVEVALPGLLWAEKSGTFVNIDGISQNIFPALSPSGDASPDNEIMKQIKIAFMGQHAKEDIEKC